MKNNVWTPSNIDIAQHLGVIEFQDNKQEFHNFGVMETIDRLIFGSFCNIGFIESGYFEKDTDFSTDENLQEMISDLETYYNDGEQYTSSSSYFTERM